MLLLPLLVSVVFPLALLLAVADCDLTLLFFDTISSQAKLENYFAGKTVWVTGASSGIGLELATQLSRLGAKLILSARREPELLRLQAALGGPSRAWVLTLDLNDLASLPGKTSEALRLAGGDIDVLVNNGGQSQRAFALDTSLEARMMLMNVDLFSAQILSETLARHWQQASSSNSKTRKEIINVVSLAGKVGSPLRTSYSAAKFGLLGYMDSLRSELRGVHVLNVCPGSVQTEIAANAIGANGSRFGVTDANIANGQPVGRHAHLIAVAAAADLDEVWTFGSTTEKLGAYVSQYLPGTFKLIMRAGHDRMLDNAHAILKLKNAGA